jgi:hypothetical protein
MISSGLLHAVLTGDIVNSTQLAPAVEKSLLEALGDLFSPYLSEFYRGDSFQVYMEAPAGSLRLCLLCRAVTISLTSTEDGAALSDIRISIGIGPVVLPVKTPGTAKGEAFLLSGRRFDEMQQSNRRLAMVSGRAIADIGFQAMADHLDAIYAAMTPKQAAAIVWLLKGQTQQEAVLQLGKSKSTVSELVTAGGWPEIEKIIQQFELLINQLENDRNHLAD